jgi:NADP-dependent 3-hydroxy acid dehydrogenase YdfG
MNRLCNPSALENRVVFISGAGSGIGRATAIQLAEAGAAVYSLDISEEGLTETANHAPEGRFAYTVGSVADEAAIAKAFAACRERFGPVEVLVNNAGVGIPTPDLAETDIDAYRKMIDVNMTGVLLCTRAALADMKTAGKGHIVTLISMAGQRTNPVAPLYCASKFGARGLSGGLADQVIKLGIKVTDINPGPVDSAYWGDRDVPRDKFLKPDDVAGVIAMVLTMPEHMVVREIDFDNIDWLAK